MSPLAISGFGSKLNLSWRNSAPTAAASVVPVGDRAFDAHHTSLGFRHVDPATQASAERPVPDQNVRQRIARANLALHLGGRIVRTAWMVDHCWKRPTPRGGKQQVCRRADLCRASAG